MTQPSNDQIRYNVRLDKGGDGHGLTFDLVLLDGREDDEFPTYIQIADSSEQISLAQDFGFDPEAKTPGPEGIHGDAYDFLKANIGGVIPDPGYFDGCPRQQVRMSDTRDYPDR